MTALFVWNDEYSVGIAEIDDQHRRLFGLINRLYDKTMQGHSDETLDATLKELVDYTQTHFSDEEKRMQAAGYPDLQSHCQEHTRLVREVNDFIAKTRNENRHAIANQLITFLFDWLTGHILETDKRYTPYLAAGKI
jgi:hemerythrin-like metal-binding protein